MDNIYLYFTIIILLIFIYILNQYLSKESFYLFKKNKLDVAVIVEPRKDKLLIEVVKNYLQLLPQYTQIHIFHGIDNEKYILNNFSEQIFKNKIIMTNLMVKNLNINEYNTILTSKNFYNKINGENILIFQIDTCLCSKTKYNIEDFLKYDYVGAPWTSNKVQYIDNKQKLNKINLVNKIGNGGLSLRKKSKILQHLDAYQYNGEPEDIYFSKSKIFKFPSVKTASNFSTEHLLNPDSVGIHKAHKNLKKHQIRKLSESCPEFKSIFL